MLFNVEHDLGDRIIGYLVPDAFTAIGSVRVCRSGELLLVFQPNEAREALVRAGRHETGICGFTIDEALIPGLAQMDDIELYDDETGCPIWRRLRPGMIHKKIARFETHLFPLWRFDESLRERFQYFGYGVERFGRESVTQMFLVQNLESFYISGRVNYKNYSFYIENGFECFTTMQEPRDELAERLLILRNMRQYGSQHLGERDAQRLVPAMQFAESLPIENEKELRWCLLDMPPEVSSLLANPVVRQFTTANPDDMPGGSAIATALDVFSTFTMVGLRDHADEFTDGVAEWLGVDRTLLPTFSRFPAVKPLGDFLRRTKAVDVILEKDMELYDLILNARWGVENDSGT